jgi:hypothetical protein
MMKRRAFLSSTLSAVTSGSTHSANAVVKALPEPLVWPIATKLPAGVRSFVGHTNTVLDVIGGIGGAASLLIFTDGNHLMVLSSNDIVGACP